MIKSNLSRLLLLSTLFVLVGTSCKTSKSALAANKPLEKALLWEVKGKDLAQSSYVYGTIHIIPAKDYFLPDGTITAIDKSKKMIYEIDMEVMNDMSAMMKMMPKLMMKNDTKLKDLVSAEDYALIEDKFKEIGIPFFFIQNFKPFFLSAMVGMDMKSMGKGGDDGLLSYEMELNKMAAAKKMPTAGLESIEGQIEMVDSIPYKLQAKMLVSSIKQGEGNNMDQLIGIYKAQDIEVMVKMMDEDEKTASAETSLIKEYEDVLLNNRNKSWIPQMAKEMRQQPTFFAVGAAHLAGPNGVLRLLMNQGYTVTPISNIK